MANNRVSNLYIQSEATQWSWQQPLTASAAATNLQQQQMGVPMEDHFASLTPVELDQMARNLVELAELWVSKGRYEPANGIAYDLHRLASRSLRARAAWEALEPRLKELEAQRIVESMAKHEEFAVWERIFTHKKGDIR